MTDARAKRLVVVAMIVAGGTATLRTVASRRGLPSSRVVVGTFAAGIMLALLAEVSPQLAGALALLVIVAALTLSVEAWQAATSAVGNAGRHPAVPAPGSPERAAELDRFAPLRNRR